MADGLKATYKIYTGGKWEKYWFETSATQVQETTQRMFIRPGVHTINEKTFFKNENGSYVAQGIILYGSDILVGSGDNETDKMTIKQRFESLTVDLDRSYLSVDRLGVATKDGIVGVATLDESGKVPTSQLPSYVDDIIDGYTNKDQNGNVLAFFSDSAKKNAIDGESGKIYVDVATHKTYRWSGTTWVEISSSLAIGDVTGTAYDGGKGKTLEGKVEAIETYHKKIFFGTVQPGTLNNAELKEGDIWIDTSA
jgi:hypothetical protein